MGANSTVYAHLSRFAVGTKPGARVARACDRHVVRPGGRLPAPHYEFRSIAFSAT
jgi:hypothetical protein